MISTEEEYFKDIVEPREALAAAPEEEACRDMEVEGTARNGELLPGDPGFNLRRAVHTYEARLIKIALQKAEGKVTNAAILLGTRHQTLIEILNGRHKNLLSERTLAKRRRTRKRKFQGVKQDAVSQR